MRAARRAPDRPSQRPPPGRLVRALFLAVAAFVIVPGALPADRETEQRDADARQKLFIRRALAEDPGLAPRVSELWVEVRGTTVILSGKLPSATLRQRALFLAGQVKGIAEVRGDELQVVAPDGGTDLPSPFVEGVPPHGALAGNHKDEPKKANLPNGGSGPAPAVILLPPVPITEPAPAASLGSAVGFLPPQPLAEPPDLASAVEALRRKEDRYRRVKAEVRGKTVSLGGTVPRQADITDLANAVRRLPGVELVILDGIKVAR